MPSLVGNDGVSLHPLDRLAQADEPTGQRRFDLRGERAMSGRWLGLINTTLHAGADRGHSFGFM